MSLVTQIGDVFLVRLNYQYGDTKAFNILHYRLQNVTVAGGGLFPGEASYIVCPKLAQTMYDELKDKWSKAASIAVSMKGASAQNITGTEKSRMYTYDAGTGWAGELAGDALPLQDCVTILKHGPGASRHDLGRTYFVGLSETGASGGMIADTVETLMVDFIDGLALLIEYTDGPYSYTFEPVLYRVDPGPPIAEVSIPVLETSLSDRVIKTQRSRRPGKGI